MLSSGVKKSDLRKIEQAIKFNNCGYMIFFN